MASRPPTSTLDSTPSVKHLIVDSSPLLTAPLSSLRGIATHYLVTPDVVLELRDKNGRNVLDEARLQLPADAAKPEQGQDEKDEMLRTTDGFAVREPTAEAIAKITAFARKTGDIAVLSATDIRVLALCLTLELEENGTWRVRDHPGQVLTGPPKEEAKKDGDAAAAVAKDEKDSGKEKKEEEQEAKTEEGTVDKVGSVNEVVDKLAKLDVENDVPEQVESVASTSASNEASTSTAPSSDAPIPSTSTLAPTPSTSASVGAAPDGEKESVDDDAEEDDASDAESTSSSGSWITPSNIHSHKVKDLGLFSAPAPKPAAPKPKTILKAAVLTGDFAMQNVGLQMGLNVLGSGGKRVKEVRTWVLRCHACFKLCKNPEKRFCPSCGGPTLLRTSITYVPASPQNPQGYILHLKNNYNYRLRGTQYSLPTPQMGKAGGQGKKSELVLREDQKEWVKGVKSAEVRQQKEQRALVRAVMEEERKGKGKGKQGAPGSSTSFFAGAGGAYGLESAMMGVAGPKGGIEHQKGRRRGGKNGAGGETRLDSSGLPVIGMGRKNPNEARRRR
ncbi:hypothetical protein JCM10212_004982 [Sporobolomyces blumeae]